MDTLMNDEQSTRPLALSYLRFSSSEQVKDAKTSDQISRAKEWAEENGYQFSETSFRDLGVSAFKGDNSSIGALGKFLKAVEDGLIPRGSALVIEALDRLSRENQWRGQMLLGNILSNGVDVVTLNDGQRYTFHDLQQDMGVAIQIILAFNLAHRESQQKSKRVAAGWRRNTELVKEGKRLRSGAVPAWVKLIGGMDDGYFEVLPDKADITRELYARFADGQTVWSIAKDFRDRGIKTPRGKTYASGNIYRSVASKAPYGILELGKGTRNNRTVFDQIDNYFPRIVDEDIERRVLFRLANMRKNNPPEAKGLTSPKRKTHGILTGVIWSPERAGGNRSVCRKCTDGTYAYVDNTTRKWVAKREVIERPFLEGWSQVVVAYDTDTTPAIDAAEAYLFSAQTSLEFAERSGSERLILAAEADVEEAQRMLKEQRRGQALALQEIPSDISQMEPWEANQVVRRVVERVDVVRGDKRQIWASGEDGRRGKQVMLTVKLRNGLKLDLGDTELIFS
jgi:DNA invertase Pin-like site-specific DNA recombinase